MDDYVSSTTANPEDELIKLPQHSGAGDPWGEENNEALAKNHVDEEDIADAAGEEDDAIESHTAEEDQPRERFSDSPSGPEPQAASEPLLDSPAAEFTVDHTKTDTEDIIPEEKIIDEPKTEDIPVQPETEATSTIVQPEPEDTTPRPDTPIEAPVSPRKETPSSESATPHAPIISSSAASLPQSLSSPGLIQNLESPLHHPLSTNNPATITDLYTAHACFNSTANMDAAYRHSQDHVKDTDEMPKDSISSRPSWHETDMLSKKADAEDDFLFERKPSASSNNPFQSFAPIGDPGSGFPLFGEATSDTRPGRMSESPTPDLVQHAHDVESQESALAEHKEPLIDLVHKEPSEPSKNLSTSTQEPSSPPVLPDILKQSPLNPEKEDSGSSEASSDSERSPGRRLQNVPHSALSSFSFDAKVLLLKEMAEETEARAAGKKQDVASAQEQQVKAFDLVKDAETTVKGQGLQSGTEGEEKDWFSSKETVKLEDRSGPPSHPSANLPPSPPPKNVVPEHSNSESPVSLFPNLDAMAKSPQNFQVEIESRCTKDSEVTFGKEEKVPFAEEGEEESEPEPSSEEFEIVERPPKGVMDEFLETLDSSTLAKAPERGMDHDLPTFGQSWKPAAVAEPELQEVGSSQTRSSSLSQTTSGPSPQMLKADLEQSDLPSGSLERDVQKPSPISRDPHARPTPEEKLKPTSVQDEDELSRETAQPEAPKPASSPMSTEAVVDLLYWRDIKTTGVVFGASLFLLLSLTVCSIVSVLSYVALALLSVSIAFRIYKGILQAVQKSDEGHPFKAYLDQDVALSEDMVHKYSDQALHRLNVLIVELRRLFLVEDLVDSLKFAVGMWLLTYVGALFNGLTLLILALIGVFSCPVIYEKNQKQIDHYLELVSSQVKDVVGKIQAKVPGLKRKAE